MQHRFALRPSVQENDVLYLGAFVAGTVSFTQGTKE